MGCWKTNTDKLRAMEVGTKESEEVIKCHDRNSATIYYVTVADEAKLPDGVESEWDIVDKWVCRWFSPMGDLLVKYESDYAHKSHPFVVKMYPLTDGEIHGFVGDIIDQQKYVNRLISLIDNIMTSSAKGVLLFPESALPQGFTWEDIKSSWSKCNSVIPFANSFDNNKPEQISTNATNIGAYELLSLQLKFFEEISGVSNALQGRTTATSTAASLYESQIYNSNIALADIFDSFNNFRKERDNMCNIILTE